MTMKDKAKADDEPAAEPVGESVATRNEAQCGEPHYLPVLAHVACTEPAPDPDRPPGTPDHQHRYQDGDAIYVW